jgi:lipoprotein-anchoring transpeptidase ErfK/SrfK
MVLSRDMQGRLFSVIVCGLFLVGLPRFVFAWDANRPVPVPPELSRRAEVVMWSADFTTSTRFLAFEKNYQQGGSVAVGDVDGDGSLEVVVGAGPARSPEVKIFSKNGTLKRTILAYASTFRGGVRVAVGDLDGDGKAEVITAPGPGLEPDIQVFSADGKKVFAESKLAYEKSFRGGVEVSVKDIDHDGKAEIFTAPGPGRAPEVKRFSAQMEPLSTFLAYQTQMHDGVTLTLAEAPEGVRVVTGVESWSEPWVREFNPISGDPLNINFLAASSSSRQGVRVAAYDADGDGIDELALVSNGGELPELHVHALDGTLRKKYLLTDVAYRGTLRVAQPPRTKGGNGELFAITSAPSVVGPTTSEKYIDVNLIQQRLYAYEHGRLARTFLVSTGIKKYPTPVVETKVLEKIPLKDYKWTYGPNHPDNYNLKDVKNNLRIYGPIYIHYAYWHHSFGHRMSHGCVNVGDADSTWVYTWAEVGTPVKTHY